MGCAQARGEQVIRQSIPYPEGCRAVRKTLRVSSDRTPASRLGTFGVDNSCGVPHSLTGAPLGSGISNCRKGLESLNA